MIFRVCPSLVVSAIVSCVFASACSSKSASEQAFVNATLSSGATMGSCNQADANTLSIGKDTAGATVSRAAGSGTIVLTCSVKAASGGFNVAIEADNNSMVTGQGGSLRIEGTVNSSGKGSNITVSLNAGGTGTYTESDCTITPSFSNMTLGLPPAPPNVAAGRIWGNVNCPNAAATENGSQTFCVASADFVFENCSE